jgi:hypothetical protein
LPSKIGVTVVWLAPQSTTKILSLPTIYYANIVFLWKKTDDTSISSNSISIILLRISFLTTPFSMQKNGKFFSYFRMLLIMCSTYSFQTSKSTIWPPYNKFLTSYPIGWNVLFYSINFIFPSLSIRKSDGKTAYGPSAPAYPTLIFYYPNSKMTGTLYPLFFL